MSDGNVVLGYQKNDWALGMSRGRPDRDFAFALR